MKLSVILTLYNEAHLLPELLKMQFDQTRPADEILIIDDCSSDNSFSLAKELTKDKPHIHVVRNEKNLGALDTINKGLTLISGDYVNIPSDNFLAATFYEESLNLLKQYPQAALSFSDPNRFEEGIFTNVSFPLKKKFVNKDDLIHLGFKHRMFIPFASYSVIFRRDLIKEFNKDLLWNCDYFIFNVIALRYGACYIPGPLSAFRIIKTSFSAKKGSLATRTQVYVKMFQLLKMDEFKDVRPLFKKGNFIVHYGAPVLMAILKRPSNSDFISLNLLNRLFRAKIIKPIESFLKS